jgi:hypothetical protein
MDQLKIAVIADRGKVSRFGLESLDAIRGCDEITVFSCLNTRAKRNTFRHAAYYALNLLTVRNPWTRRVPVDQGKKQVKEIVDFTSGLDGVWQTLPPEVIGRMRDGGFDVVVKLGTGLLRVPPPEVLPVPILSFHHGDPSRYRGRPAGFWEIVHGEPVMGQIVQVIGNRLDSGRVVAFAETKVFPHSYRATLVEAYRHSPLLLDTAIKCALAGEEVPIDRNGRNYRLPCNLAVARFVMGRWWRSLRRQVYGAVFEKHWHVSTAMAPRDPVSALERGELLSDPAGWRTIKPRRGYAFYADPFVSEVPSGVLVEALKSTTGRGEILLVQGESHRRVSPAGGHFSYPATMRLGDRQLVLPETASWSPPICYAMDERQLEPLGPLDIDPAARIVDPTPVEHRGQVYLFGNLRSTGSNALYVWVADSISSPFRLHHLSPVRISPRGARMAGGFIRSEGRLIRLGQDFGAGYGDGIHLFEVDELSPTAFHERLIGEIRFADRKGPHTLNLGDDLVAFDWYMDRFAPLAGVRRLLARARRS